MNGKWLDKNGKATKKSFGTANEFKTDTNGIIKIENLPIGNKYQVYETSLGEYKHVYALNSIKIEGKNETAKYVWAPTIQTSGDNEKTITNKQKYIKLSGFVWLDNKTSDNKFNPNEARIGNVQVKLKDQNGTVIKATTTSTTRAGVGRYEFDKVEIKNLGNYHVEFIYDGLTYENVKVNKNDMNGAKASEGTGRESFNNMFKAIEYDTTINNTKLTYDSEVHKSINTNKVKTSKMNETNTRYDLKIENEGDFTISATTENAGYNLKDKYDAMAKNGIVTEISGINLGLYEREMPDLAVVNDLYSVKVSINGYEHIYTYDERGDERI